MPARNRNKGVVHIQMERFMNNESRNAASVNINVPAGKGK